MFSLLVCEPSVCHARGGQNWGGIPLELELQIVGSYQCGCWEVNLGPLQNQQVFLTFETSLQPPMSVFCFTVFL